MDNIHFFFANICITYIHMCNIRYFMRLIYYYYYIALGTEKARFGGFLDGKKKH